MLISDGRIAHLGEPDEVGRRYLRSNFERGGAASAFSAADADENAAVRMLDARVVDANGERASSVEHGEKIRLQIEIEARHDFAALAVGYLIVNGDGVGVCQLRGPIGGDPPPPIKAGERLRIETTVDNLLGPGHYFVHCGINRALEGGVALDVPSAIDFVVFGGPEERALVSLPQETTTTAIGGTGA